VDKAEDYRRKAEEAEQEAEHVKDPEAQRILREVAENYRKLATYSERTRS